MAQFSESKIIPEPESKPLLVTAAMILDGSKILVARRMLNAAVEAGKWEFPGGKVEHGEHPEDCLKREIREELNLQVEITKLIGLSSHVYERPGKEPLHVVLLGYLCCLNGGELKKLGVEDVRWVELEEMESLDFAAADLPLIAALLDQSLS